jgi:hypothetical protein
VEEVLSLTPRMVFSKRLRPRIKTGRIRCTIRVWQSPRVKVGGRYPLDDGSVVVDAMDRIRQRDITEDLARESGFDSVEDLMSVAKHGKGRNIYLIRFHYLQPGAWS